MDDVLNLINIVGLICLAGLVIGFLIWIAQLLETWRTDREKAIRQLVHCFIMVVPVGILALYVEYSLSRGIRFEELFIFIVSFPLAEALLDHLLKKALKL